MPTSAASRLQALFADAIELDGAARAALLDRECADDAALREQLEALLSADARLAGATARPLALGLTQILASTVPAFSLTGLHVGPFELREELGRGGMGLVYRAERVDGTVEQQVAIKFVRRELLDPNTLKRFQLERQMLASLDHPNIARLLDASELEDGTPYYVMEYVPGAPITAHCDRARASVRERVALVRLVCSAVAHAHRNLIVHRDLKPSNIHVSDAGVPKLLDFGIAKPLRAGHEATGTAERFFSPQYAAPEQVRGQPVGVGCDVYALGLILFELLAGRPAFDLEGLTAGQAERQICEVPPPAPSTVTLDRACARELRGELDDIVLRCLKKSPTERYSSAEQLEADLGNYLEGRPVEARGGHAWYRVRKFVARHRVPVAAGAAAFVAIAAAAIVLARQNVELTHERDRAQYAVSVLKDSFSSADPGKSAGADVTARQILDAAEVRLDGADVAQPELYSAIGGTLIEVELAIGRSPKAAQLAAHAVASASRAGLDNATRARLMVMRAEALALVGSRDEARAQLKESASLGAAADPAWLLVHGRVLALEARPRDAVPVLRQALDQVSSRPASDDLATRVRWQLADAYASAGEMDQRLAVLDDTLRWERATLPASHPYVALTRLRRVDALLRLERFAEALSEARETVADVERYYGRASSFAASARLALGGALLAHGDRAAAAEQDRAALDDAIAVLGEKSELARRTAYNLADALSTDARNDVEAESLYRRAGVGDPLPPGTSNPTALFVRGDYAVFLLDRARRDEALDLLTLRDADEALSIAPQDLRARYLRALRDASRICGPAQAASIPSCRRAADLIETLSMDRPQGSAELHISANTP